MSTPRQARRLLAVVGAIVLAGFAAYAYLHRGTAPLRSSKAGSRPSCVFVSARRDRPRRDADRARGRRGGSRRAAVHARCRPAARGGGRERGRRHQRPHHLRARPGAAEEGGRLAEGLRRCRGGAAHRRGAAQLGQARGSSGGASPAPSPASVQEVYYPRRRDGAAGPADRVAAAARQHQGALLRAAGDRCRRCTSAIASPSAATAAPATWWRACSFISAQAEFTPPVIYSQEERARLVFRVEAIPERPADLRVGQPVIRHAAACRRRRAMPSK